MDLAIESLSHFKHPRGRLMGYECEPNTEPHTRPKHKFLYVLTYVREGPSFLLQALCGQGYYGVWRLV